jgi:copper resistance protein C
MPQVQARDSRSSSPLVILRGAGKRQALALCGCAALLWLAASSERATAFPQTAAPVQNLSKSPRLLLAHAIIVRTSPPQGGVAAGNIAKVDVWYDAGIRDSLAALAVIGAGGERVDKRDAAIDSADAAHVSVSVNPLTPGKYTVRYRALSADGHLVSGAWDFEVTP